MKGKIQDLVFNILIGYISIIAIDQHGGGPFSTKTLRGA